MMKTFLSDEIYSLVQYFARETENTDEANYITSDLFVNWDLIDAIFGDASGQFIIHELPDEWFNNKMPSLHAVMNDATHKLLNCKPEHIPELWERCSWTNRVKDIVMCHEYLLENDECKLLEALLVLTTIIERSLGDLYRMQNRDVPFLLRDLLDTEYLYSVLGNGAIRLMQTLFGTPRFLNIRNLAWHGFLSLGELKRNHVSVLFIIIASIGDILTQCEISVEDIPHRQEVPNFDEKVALITRRNKFVDILRHQQQATEILHNTSSIGASQITYWNKILQYALEHRNTNCAVLFLPQFEHLLRRVFGKINDCADRTMTAIEKEKYTTLDDIFAPNLGKLPETPNKLFDLLGVAAVELYEDLFSHLAGPRIRDKISHGEKHLDTMPCDLINILLNLTFYVMIKANSGFQVAEEYPASVNMVSELNLIFRNYESVFHPNSILKFKLLEVYEEILSLSFIPKPKCDELAADGINFAGNSFQKTGEWLQNRDFCTFLRQMKTPTVLRAKEEAKPVRKLVKIVNTVSQICQQVIRDANLRFELFTNKTLGVRQRERFPEILHSILIVQDALKGISNLVLYLIHIQFQLDNEEFLADRRVVKFLKNTHTYVDKVLRFSDVKYNKWDKVRQLTDVYSNQALLFTETNIRSPPKSCK